MADEEVLLPCPHCGESLYDNVAIVAEPKPGQLPFGGFPPDTALCGSCLEPLPDMRRFQPEDE